MSVAQAIQPSTRESWQTRRERVLSLLQYQEVRAVIDSLTQTLPSETPASQVSAPDEHSHALDLALSAWWPVCTSSRQDTNTHRASASEALAGLALANVKESDFTTESSLMRGGGGFCEVMRCRMDRQLYVVKSASKRTVIHASRVSNLSPALERHILSLATQAASKLGESPAPIVHAAWQGRNDVFIAMEYFPVGDLHMLLASAGEARASCAMSDAEGRIREDHARSFGKDMVSAVSWLHAEGYMHRDIKPANWLVANSGHLKLCDFGIAAPFSTYGASRRRVHHSHNLIAGTSDYLSPELLILRQERAEKEHYSYDDSGCMWDSPQKAPGIEFVEPAPDAEGDYGPDIDWWGVGLILYEMTYRLLPFVGTPSQVVEQKLNLAECFRIDATVPRSEDLQDLLRALIAMPEDRLGRTSSKEIENHPFFQCKDWSRPYAHSAPFRPTLPGQGPDGDPELSIVHSPRAVERKLAGWDSLMSPSVQSSFHASKVFAGLDHLSHLDEADEQSPGMPLRGADDWARAAQGTGTLTNEDETDVSSTLVSSSPAAKALERRDSRALSGSPSLDDGPLWSDTDCYFVGHSLLPGPSVFERPVALQRPPTLPAVTPTAAKLRFVEESPEYSPPKLAEGGADQGPLASTPYGKIGAGLPGPPPLSSTPWHGSVAQSLHRHAIETASRAASGMDRGSGAFVTPLRKTSMPSLGTSFRNEAIAQHSDAAGGQNMAPSSPYPFPLASALRGGTPGTGLRRHVLDRARSGTPGAASESTHSGGSNAPRQMSEQEAWEEMWTAAASVRKPPRPAGLPRSSPMPPPALVPSRPSLPHSQTETALTKRNMPEPKLTTQDDTAVPSPRAAAAPTLGAALMGSRRAQLPRFLKGDYNIQRPALRPLVTLASPKSSTMSSPGTESSSPLSARLGMPPPAAPSLATVESRDASMNTSANLTLPAPHRLAKRRSARQLLLRAQEKTTPTKPTRANSPLLSSFRELDLSGPGPPSALGPGPSTSALPARSPSTALDTFNWPGFSPTIDAPAASLPVLGAPLGPPVTELSGKRGTSPPEHPRLRAGREGLRRRDSREILIGFRQGIVRQPSESSEENFSGFLTTAGSLGGAAARLNGVMGPTHSPSLPSLHDAFGPADPEAVVSVKSLRRASMVPLRDHGQASMPPHSSRLGRDVMPEPVPEHSMGQPAKPRRRMGSSITAGRTISKQSSDNALGLNARSRWGTDAVTQSSSPAEGDVSAVTGMSNRHRALQGAVGGIERRLASLKQRLLVEE